jgi:hypothetical protein
MAQFVPSEPDWEREEETRFAKSRDKTLINQGKIVTSYPRTMMLSHGKEVRTPMSGIMGHIIEWLIICGLLGVTIALGGLLIALILVFHRERVMVFIKRPFIMKNFEQLCELSDRLDKPQRRKRPFRTAERGLWLVHALWRGLICEAGLMVLWIAVMAVWA